MLMKNLIAMRIINTANSSCSDILNIAKEKFVCSTTREGVIGFPEKAYKIRDDLKNRILY